MARPPKYLPAVQPNAGLRVMYDKRIMKLIRKMVDDVTDAVLKVYEENPPRVAELAAAMAEDAFDPSERRDEEGRWTEGGGAGKSAQVHTPEFKAWLGKSKAASRGVPMVVYHGTGELGIKEFNTETGAWFSTKPALADKYSGAKSYGEGQSPTVYPVFLKIEKPVVIKKDMNDKSTYAEIRKLTGLNFTVGKYGDEVVDGTEQKFLVHRIIHTPEFVAAAKAAGYDGVKVNEGKIPTFAVFDPKQVKSAYGNKGTFDPNSPVITDMAMDELPSDQLRRLFRELSKQWRASFDTGAQELAEYFAQAASQRSDMQLKAILTKAGFAVAFKLTPAQRDILEAVVAENVTLIKSIPEQYLTAVGGAVMRSVQTGRDVGGLRKELEEQFGVTRRRASLIARDQNQKATSAFNRARQLEIGVTKARWKHSHAGKTPRPTHLANDGNLYDVATGWYDPHEKEWIWPGQLINCRCTSQSLFPGLQRP